MFDVTGTFPYEVIACTKYRRIQLSVGMYGHRSGQPDCPNHRTGC